MYHIDGRTKEAHAAICNECPFDDRSLALLTRAASSHETADAFQWATGLEFRNNDDSMREVFTRMSGLRDEVLAVLMQIESRFPKEMHISEYATDEPINHDGKPAFVIPRTHPISIARAEKAFSVNGNGHAHGQEMIKPDEKQATPA